MTIHPWNVRLDKVGAAIAGCLLAALASSGSAFGQPDPRRGPPGCVPAAERHMERGCYILVSDPLGELPAVPLYWHIDAYPDRAVAEAARGPHGTVVEALGKVWLMSIAEENYRAPGGKHVAEVGPLLTTAGVSYTAAYMEGIMLPGATTMVHPTPVPRRFTLWPERSARKPQRAGSSAIPADRRSSSRRAYRTS